MPGLGMGVDLASRVNQAEGLAGGGLVSLPASTMNLAEGGGLASVLQSGVQEGPSVAQGMGFSDAVKTVTGPVQGSFDTAKGNAKTLLSDSSNTESVFAQTRAIAGDPDVRNVTMLKGAFQGMIGLAMQGGKNLVGEGAGLLAGGVPSLSGASSGILGFMGLVTAVKAAEKAKDLGIISGPK